MLPESRGKTYILRILSVYNDLFKHKYGFYPQIPIPRFGASLKRLIETHSELQISAMLIVFFNWKGMNGEDEYSEQKLIDAGHHFGWFFSSLNSYEIYLRNIYKLNLDDEEMTRDFVAKHLLEIKK